MERRLAIVMGRNYTSRLGMIRAAGMAGCDVAVVQTDRDGGKGKKPVDAYSRYVTAGLFRSPGQDTGHLIALLLREFSKYEPKPVLLPTDDYTASAVDLNIEKLKGCFLLPGIHGQQGKVVEYMDKAKQKELARKAGFDVAKGWSATWSNGRYSIPEDVEYPCFIKPEISFKGANKQSMQRCDSRAQLEAALSGIEGHEDYPILIEQFIEIEREYAVLGYCDAENVVAPDLIIMEQSDLGVIAHGTICSINQCEGLFPKLERFMKSTGFTGLFDVDLYQRGGIVYFNELNLRFGASGYAVLKCGVNLPEIFIQKVSGMESDESFHIEDTRSFNNEKVLLQMLGKCTITKADYDRLRCHADFSFIEDRDDPEPYAAFRREERNTKMKLLVKRILHIR